jgi:tRNA-splicing ligase RtcB
MEEDQGIEGILSYYSTVHGAGRAMSRTKAKGKTNRRTGEIISPGVVSQEAMDKWVHDEGVELRGADLDEAPQAYKRIEQVMEHHLNTVRIVHTLRPIGVAMAGRDVIDPWKD